MGEALTSVSSAAADVAGALGQRVPFEVYEHHSAFLFPRWSSADEEAHRILRQKRRRASVAEGESGCCEAAAGHRFSLEGHPAPQVDGGYAFTTVSHHGESEPSREGGGRGVVYWNHFECVPGSMPFPPKRLARKSVQVSLTATVVGPPGEEIHVDDKGQIKVQFHWDRSGAHDDRSSCWIRTMQPWAGAAFGHQFIPRVGMEVVVVFEGGDPDKPMVIGTVYNGTHPPPFLLPANKTQSGVRTQSSPGGKGFNELMFEDAAGRERVYVHAQRDLDEVVGRDHTLSVRANESLRISGDRRDVVEGHAHLDVGKHRAEVVRGDAEVRHLGTRVDVVEKTLDQRVAGARSTRVGGRDDLEVKGPAEHRFLADVVTRVTGNHTVVVGKNDAPRALTVSVEGATSLMVGGEVTLVARKGIVLTCGATTLRIGEDGIELNGAMLRLAGAGGELIVDKSGLKLATETVRTELTDRLLIKTEKTSLSMKTEVKIDGQKILLNSPDIAKDEPAPEPPPPTEIVLSDVEGKPLVRQRFVIELEDGSQRSGVTDDEGRAKLTLPTGGKIKFPELSDIKA